MQNSDNNGLEAAVDALGTSIARLIENGALHTTALSPLQFQ